MSDKNGNSSEAQDPEKLKDLEERIAAAKSRHSGEEEIEVDNSLLGMAWRISTELVVTVLVGCALGLGIDTVLGTKPWFIILGLCLGTVAALRNVFRLVARMEEEEKRKQEAKGKS